MNNMKTVYLHGSLGKRFGKGPFSVNAQTTQMAIAGLIHRFGQAFKTMIREGRWHVFKNLVKVNNDIAEAEVAMTLGNKVEELHIIPVTAGSGKFFQLIVGVILIVVGAILTFYGYGNIGIPMMKIGAALVIGGIAQLLTPSPKMTPPTQAGGNPSTMFNGTVNVTEQGVPMFIQYGRVPRASSIVAAAWLKNINTVPTSS
jgi:predicted phage tail protein